MTTAQEIAAYVEEWYKISDDDERLKRFLPLMPTFAILALEIIDLQARVEALEKDLWGPED